jgi:hypothetical protein
MLKDELKKINFKKNKKNLTQLGMLNSWFDHKIIISLHRINWIKKIEINS